MVFQLSQPGIPSILTARTQLASITVTDSYDAGGYSRDLFLHWEAVSGTRNIRLKANRHKHGEEQHLHRDIPNLCLARELLGLLPQTSALIIWSP
jgi:hypothetical protein